MKKNVFKNINIKNKMHRTGWPKKATKQFTTKRSIDFDLFVYLTNYLTPPTHLSETGETDAPTTDN